MAAQFARSLPVLRLLPSAQRLYITRAESRIHAERVQQPIRVQSRNVAAIPFLRVGKDAVRQQPDLPHRKWFGLERDWFRCELRLAFESGRIRSDRPPEVARRRRRLLCGL